MNIGCRIAPLFAAFALSMAPAFAQPFLFRAYLASDGSDSNPCTLAQPCRLLPAALAAVMTGGEIWMLDSANYNTGPVGIDKSVTVLAIPGAVGSLVARNDEVYPNAIYTASNNIKVTLRNLSITPLSGSGAGHTSGVIISTIAVVHMEGCVVAGHQGNGVVVNSLGAVAHITDSTIRDNGNSGVFVQGGGRAFVARTVISENTEGVLVTAFDINPTTADISDSVFRRNQYGVRAESGVPTGVVKVSVHTSQVVANSNYGLIATSNSGAAVSLAAGNNVISGNATSGIAAENAGSKIWASANLVSHNGYGFFNNGGNFESAGNNALRDNIQNKFGTITMVPTE